MKVVKVHKLPEVESGLMGITPAGDAWKAWPVK